MCHPLGLKFGNDKTQGEHGYSSVFRFVPYDDRSLQISDNQYKYFELAHDTGRKSIVVKLIAIPEYVLEDLDDTQAALANDVIKGNYD